MELRDYQEAARQAVHDEWAAGRRRTLMVLPTGTGKTVVFAKVIEDVVRKGGRALVLAHRGELLDQAADKLLAVTGLGANVEKAGQSAFDDWYRVCVGSVQTMMRDRRLSAFPPDYFDLIVVDEAHHTLAEGYLKVLGHFPGAKVLGVTATADRGDRRDLGQYYDSLAYEYSMLDAVRDGWLCKIQAQTIPLKIDLSGVSVSQGDFKASDLGTALDPYLEAIAEEMVAAGCLGRKTVVFLPLIKTSQKFAGMLAARGFACAEVNGESRDRADVLQRFASGSLNVLCNSMLLTEGWDCPDVDCIVVLRPTKVRSLYAQMVGRGTRVSPGKEALLVLDFLWHSKRHELCHPAHLVTDDAEAARLATTALEAAGMPVDVEEAVSTATDDMVRAAEERLALRLDEMRQRQRQLVDPVQYAYSIQSSDLLGYEPEFPWQTAPPSKAQLAALEKAGIFPDEVPNAGYASMLIDKLVSRKAAGLATPKQIRLLERKGFVHVGDWGFQAANRLIGRISTNGWRVPDGIDPASYVPKAMARE
ncbi:MAG: DEAD/DEAH box helicase [Coriobacteriia bacterium]|nr:DEAD/DEAH box helicase [Coriobacteriia bacterium]